MRVAKGRFDLSELGNVSVIDRPAPDGHSDRPDRYKLSFDTGAILYLPPLAFQNLRPELVD